MNLLGGSTLPLHGFHEIPFKLFGSGVELFLGSAGPAEGPESEHFLVKNMLPLEEIEDVGQGGEHLVLVGGHAEYDSRGLPGRGQGVGGIFVGNLVDMDRNLFGADALDYRFQHFLGVAVHTSPYDGNFRLCRTFGVIGVTAVSVDDGFGIFPPDQPVGGGYHFDSQVLQLVDGPGNEGGEAGYDVGVVAQGFPFVEKVLFIVDLVVENRVAQASVGAEGVAGEEHLGAFLIGHHGFGPVNIGRLHEEELLAFSELQGVSRFDNPHIFGNAVKRLEDCRRLLGEDDFTTGIFFQKSVHPAGVIRLHVVEYKVVDILETDV